MDDDNSSGISNRSEEEIKNTPVCDIVAPPSLNPRIYKLYYITIVLVIISFAINIGVNSYFDSLDNEQRARNQAQIRLELDKKFSNFEASHKVFHRSLDGKLKYIRDKNSKKQDEIIAIQKRILEEIKEL